LKFLVVRHQNTVNGEPIDGDAFPPWVGRNNAVLLSNTPAMHLQAHRQ
jgi:hypothetical protein